MGKITIAVEGCCHGELDKIYATLQHLEQREGKKIDLLICCGDFQAVRNLDDLETMACPQKYRSMQTFYKYYSGERVAPYPTLFIGGNHEAANHLWELYHGGWAAPNIYFLGFAGAVRFGGLRIAGLSGIYKSHDYLRGHHEALPYNDKTIRSMYHIRDFEVYRLMQLQQPVDIFLSHDWPTGIARYGNMQQLLARKSFLRSEVEDGTLGSPPAAELLAALRPAYWFSAHLHTKFAALVQHPVGAPGAGAGAGSAAGGQAQGQGGAQGPGGQGPGGTTRFLALDKCLPGRDFLQVLELDAPGPPELHYDEEWLAVMRSTHHLVNLRFAHAPLPGMGRLRAGPKPEDVDFVRRALAERGGSRVPSNFAPTAPAYDPAAGQRRGRMPQHHVRNPQTVALLELVGLPYNLDHGAAGAPGQRPAGVGQQQQGTGQSQRAPLMVGGRLAAPPPSRPQAGAAAAVAAPNPEEIDLADLDDDEAEQADAQPQQQPEPGQGQGEGQEGGAKGAAGGKGASLADDPMFQPLDL